jgi:cell wall-associated NlpC family hydrolase
MKAFKLRVLCFAALYFASCASIDWTTGRAPSSGGTGKTQSSGTAAEAPSGNGLDAARARILAAGEVFIDAPYKSPPSPPKNFDCSGFVRYIFWQNTGLSLPSSSSGYATVGKPIDIRDAEPGDLLIFTSNPGGSQVNHVAILYQKSADGELRGSLLLHAVSIPAKTSAVKGNPDTTGVKISEVGKRSDGKWEQEYFLSRFYGIRRVMGQ